MDLSRQLPSSSMSAYDICNDIIIEILSWLPVDSLLLFKSVSKSWFSLITNPIFVKLHIDHQHLLTTAGATQIHNPCMMFISDKHYTMKSMDEVLVASSIIEKHEFVNFFDFPQQKVVSIVGSCNGLICLHAYNKNMHGDGNGNYDGDENNILCLWNPSTKEFRMLPSHGTDHYYNDNGTRLFKFTRYGFGYDHVIDDYKVIASLQLFYANELSNDDDNKEEEEAGIFQFYESEVRVYTLGTNSWRWIQGKQPYKFERIYDNNCSRNITTWTHVNGVFHRITQLSSSKLRLLSFDVVHEVSREVPNPECFDSRYVWHLTVLKGCLCLSARAHDQFVDMEVWMMVDYGVKESWTKLFNITNNDVDIKRLKLAWLHKNGEVVMVGSSYKNGDIVMVGSSELVIYDPKKDHEVNQLKLWSSNVREDCLGRFETEIYIGSLVSLKSYDPMKHN